MSTPNPTSPPNSTPTAAPVSQNVGAPGGGLSPADYQSTINLIKSTGNPNPSTGPVLPQLPANASPENIPQDAIQPAPMSDSQQFFSSFGNAFANAPFFKFYRTVVEHVPQFVTPSPEATPDQIKELQQQAPGLNVPTGTSYNVAQLMASTQASQNARDAINAFPAPGISGTLSSWVGSGIGMAVQPSGIAGAALFPEILGAESPAFRALFGDEIAKNLAVKGLAQGAAGGLGATLPSALIQPQQQEAFDNDWSPWQALETVGSGMLLGGGLGLAGGAIAQKFAEPGLTDEVGAVYPQRQTPFQDPAQANDPVISALKNFKPFDQQTAMQAAQTAISQVSQGLDPDVTFLLKNGLRESYNALTNTLGENGTQKAIQILSQSHGIIMENIGSNLQNAFDLSNKLAEIGGPQKVSLPNMGSDLLQNNRGFFNNEMARLQQTIGENDVQLNEVLPQAIETASAYKVQAADPDYWNSLGIDENSDYAQQVRQELQNELDAHTSHQVQLKKSQVNLRNQLQNMEYIVRRAQTPDESVLDGLEAPGDQKVSLPNMGSDLLKNNPAFFNNEMDQLQQRIAENETELNEVIPQAIAAGTRYKAQLADPDYWNSLSIDKNSAYAQQVRQELQNELDAHAPRIAQLKKLQLNLRNQLQNMQERVRRSVEGLPAPDSVAKAPYIFNRSAWLQQQDEHLGQLASSAYGKWAHYFATDEGARLWQQHSDLLDALKAHETLLDMLNNGVDPITKPDMLKFADANTPGVADFQNSGGFPEEPDEGESLENPKTALDDTFPKDYQNALLKAVPNTADDDAELQSIQDEKTKKPLFAKMIEAARNCLTGV